LNILVVVHHQNSGSGTFGDSLAAAGARERRFEPWTGASLPDSTDGIDGLVILGGTMTALDDRICPYFPPLLELTRVCHAQAKPVLGICLGAQLVARAFGAKLHVHGPIEFGYRPVRRLPAAATDPLFATLEDQPRLLQWHTDHYDLPPGAVHLMTGDCYPHQAYRIGESVYGVQFHPEADPAMLEHWLTLDESIHRRIPDLMDWFPTEMAAHAPAQAKTCDRLARAWLGLVEARRRRAA
jgi:GMP synthase-like glutamine amidotransferase